MTCKSVIPLLSAILPGLHTAFDVMTLKVEVVFIGPLAGEK
jgi:hypothetical protein